MVVAVDGDVALIPTLQNDFDYLIAPNGVYPSERIRRSQKSGYFRSESGRNGASALIDPDTGPKDTLQIDCQYLVFTFFSKLY
jgi:hypothetical protein